MELKEHECEPKWNVWVLNHHEVGNEGDCLFAYAHYPEDAGTKAVSDWDDEGCTLKHPVTILVRRAVALEDDDDNDGEWFEVTAEASVKHTARQIDPPALNGC